MYKNNLEKYFKWVLAKRVTSVEVVAEKSNQHEFQGTKMLREYLGKSKGKTKFKATFLWFEGEEDCDSICENDVLTWYDTRSNQPKRSPEYRLYYSSSTTIPQRMRPGDLLVIAMKTDGTFLIICTRAFSKIENQLVWLFDLNNLLNGSQKDFSKGSLEGLDQEKVEFLINEILESLQIKIENREEEYLDKMIDLFGNQFPTTFAFSDFARKTYKYKTTEYDPDSALLEWINHEEKLFKSFEEYLLKPKLKEWSEKDQNYNVDEFINLANSVLNRRKSRAGHSLENHLNKIFQDSEINFNHQAVTENNNKPDFLFPGKEQYDDANYPAEKLSMLAAKRTLKDRWRQITKEAERIKFKHLITLEIITSKNKMEQIYKNNICLVQPKSLQRSSNVETKLEIITLSDFIEHIRNIQK